MVVKTNRGRRRPGTLGVTNCWACGREIGPHGGSIGPKRICWACFESFGIWLTLRNPESATGLPADKFAKYSDLVHQLHKSEWGRLLKRP